MMPCSVSGGSQGSPGLLVVTRTDLDSGPHPPPARRHQTDREFFRLSNRLQDNRKVREKEIAFNGGEITILLCFSILPLIASLIIHSTKTTT